MYKLMRRGETGFTLIELLMVLSVISLIAVITMSALGKARTKARDADRINEIRQLGLALALYRSENDAFPRYQDPGAFTTGGVLETELVDGGFISEIPVDDTLETGTQRYYYSNDDDGVSARVELDDNSDTYAIRFYQENSLTYYCLTARGIHAEAEEGDGDSACEQR